MAARICCSICLGKSLSKSMDTALYPPPDQSGLPLEARSGLIVFDGVCVLCNGFVQFVLRHDKAAQFRFLIAQSEKGEALYAEMGLKHGDYDTNLVFIDGRLFVKLDAFLAVMNRLSWPWRLVWPLKYLPRRVKDWIYDRIARNRYRLFGKRESCMAPEASVKARFVE
jgi:predicted DCC family thiol-disulfide oxidoreductase YuxK